MTIPVLQLVDVSQTFTAHTELSAAEGLAG